MNLGAEAFLVMGRGRGCPIIGRASGPEMRNRESIMDRS